MAKFSDLSLRAQRELMEEYRNKGINDLSDMIADYEKEVPSNTASSGTSVSVPFSLAETYRNGGKIHIKPENRGKFTALKKRTGHSASWFKAHGTPAQKKMAVFALNARKWKHGEGGFLKNYFELGGPEGENWFTRATLNAAMADSPAVMQSMGWEPTNKGPVQGDWSAPGPTALRESLAEIATIPLTDGLVDLAGAAITGSKLYKSYKVAKALKNAVKESKATTPALARSGSPISANATQAVNPSTSKVVTGTDVEVEALRNRFNKWADYYGYDKIPESYTVEQAEEQMRKTFDRHNTFFRGLQEPFLKEDIESLDKILGKDRTYDETMAYMATHGRPDHEAVYASPTVNAAIYGDGENIAIVRRNYSLGDNPSRWLQDADFDIVYGNAVGGRAPEEINKMFSELPSNKIIFPWSSSGNGIVENEVLIPSGRASFAGYVPVDNLIEYIEANGSLNKYLGNKFYFGYDMGIPLEKPKFEDGGFLQQYPDGGLVVPLTLPQQNFMWNPEGASSGAATRKINRDTQEKEVAEKPSLTQLLDLEAIGGIRSGVQPKRAASSREVSVPETVFTADTNNGIQRDIIFNDSLPAENFLGDTDSYKRTVPNRDARRYFQTEVGKLDYGAKEQRRQDYSKLPKTDIMAKQQELADAGLYEKQLEGLSKEEIKNIQTKLVNRGLLDNAKRSDGSYVEVDGIVGKRTKVAWNSYNVDGVWGKRSEMAESMQEKPSSDTAKWSDFYSAKGVDGCAKWVTRKFESVMGEVSQQNGVVGDAWQMPKNIVSAGGTMLFNIYDDPEFDNIVSENDLKTKTKDKLSKLKIDYSSLEPGDVVGIYMPMSNHHGDVLKNGTTYNTHVGIVTGKDSNGMPIVEHNIYGNNHKDLANNLRVVVAARPKNSVNVKEYPFTSGVSKYYVDNGKFNENSQPENLKSYMDSMAGAAPVIGKIYKNADMDAVQKIATAVLRRETGYMQNLESERKGVDAVMEKMEKFGRRVKGMSAETKSSDLSKFKLSTLSPDERKFLGITSKEDLDNPEKAGLASMLILAKNYDYFSRYAKQNPDLGMTAEDIENLTALSYNQGMSNLYKITKSGLESIRRSAENSEKIEDFDSTTPGRIADAFPIAAPLMQGLFNLGLGTRSTSYAYSARNAMNEQIKKKSGK